jgi:hypothetical protein
LIEFLLQIPEFGYTEPPIVSISGGGGFGGIATAVINTRVLGVIGISSGRSWIYYSASSYNSKNFHSYKYGISSNIRNAKLKQFSIPMVSLLQFVIPTLVQDIHLRQQYLSLILLQQRSEITITMKSLLVLELVQLDTLKVGTLLIEFLNFLSLMVRLQEENL